MATAFFGPAKQKAPVESSGSVLHVGLAGQSPLPIPGMLILAPMGQNPGPLCTAASRQNPTVPYLRGHDFRQRNPDELELVPTDEFHQR
jgi:hypothetical protein